ncbi:GIY-YIG nuclease family protein [Endozoicomonas elysicola]|uniref:Endonuclease n=1 Tax=Endozoicomonas elysicola TaxID=305900 RepID=A0A081KG10_9GAMM|nr:GIY-YIG nuclease family protein [Endozoicomonas elysicola]KEI73086.1 endonuclease [Endozoicomonas elysicola]
MPAGYWSVYIILASDNSLYTGITTDIVRRWQQHCGAAGGARFFRGRKPKQLVYLEDADNRSSASRREAAIKKLTRKQKLILLSSSENRSHLWADKLLPAP